MPRASLAHLPNMITIARIALVPVLILLLKDQDYAAGLIVFVIAGASDALDGYLAKRLNVQSRLGAILDPVADKLAAGERLRDAHFARAYPVLAGAGRGIS